MAPHIARTARPESILSLLSSFPLPSPSADALPVQLGQRGKRPGTTFRPHCPLQPCFSSRILPPLLLSLQTLYLCNSGSEANDLALRIARTARPGATHVAVMAGAYHGHLQTLIEMSPYKFWGTGGQGRPVHVHVLPCPDAYR